MDKVLITTVGKNTDRLKYIIQETFVSVYILLSSNEKNKHSSIKNELKKIFPTNDLKNSLHIINVSSDDINDVFNNAIKTISQTRYSNAYPQIDIVVNPSGGSTSMRIGLYRAGVLTNCKVKLTTGERDKGHQIVNARDTNLNKGLINLVESYDKIETCFFNYDYENGKEIFSDYNLFPDSAKPICESLMFICELFSDWDQFNFTAVSNKLSHMNRNLPPKVKTALQKTYKPIVENILSSDEEIHPSWITELWNSAIRSLQRKQYAETMLKIYRFLEAVAQNCAAEIIDKRQIRLNKMDLSACLIKIEDNPVKKGVPGTEFLIKNYSWIKDISAKRNVSIFAHGYKPIVRSDLESIKFKLENELIEDLENSSYPSHPQIKLKFKDNQLPNSLKDFGVNINEVLNKI